MTKQFLVYYELLNGDFRMIKSTEDGRFKNDIKPDDIETLTLLPKTKDYKRFHLFSNYEATDEGLKKYYFDFQLWNNELLTNDIFKIKYISCHYSHSNAVEGLLRVFGINFNDDANEKIDMIESKWIDNCNNGGLTYCSSGTYNTFSYDFVSNYPSILADKYFIIPIKRGKELIKKKLEMRDIQLGYYRCKIECDNEDFKKIMTFSKHNTYTHHTLNFLRKHQEKYDIKIELIQDDKPNTYQYGDCKSRDMVKSGQDIFGKWFYKLTELKKKYPKNKLIKHLLSSVWGNLIQKIVMFKNYDALEGLDIGDEYDSEYGIINHHIKKNSEYYEIVKYDNLYKHNCRIKAFLTSFARNKISKLALLDIRSVVRIQTDACSFNKEQDISKYNDLKLEDKTTGKIYFKNCNSYIKVKENQTYNIGDKINKYEN